MRRQQQQPQQQQCLPRLIVTPLCGVCHMMKMMMREMTKNPPGGTDYIWRDRPGPVSSNHADAGWLDGWMDGWLDGWVDGWMDGWMDE